MHGANWRIQCSPRAVPAKRRLCEGLLCAGLLRPGFAPAADGYALAHEDIAAAAGIARLSLELRASSAFLVGLVGLVGGGIHLRGIGDESQSLSGRILRIQRRKSSGLRGPAHQAHGWNDSAGDQSAFDDGST